jgi:hypothetical protein
VRITFANGETYEPETNVRLHQGSASLAIDLPGNTRAIETIELRLRDLPRRGKATVQVWGEKTERARIPRQRPGWY